MKVDISAYLVVGRENTNDSPVAQIVEDAVRAGFTCVQIRSKTSSAMEMIEDCREAANVIKNLGKSDSVALLVDDRLDIVLAARELGIKVDGVHVGQSDIPVSICRKFLGKDANSICLIYRIRFFLLTILLRMFYTETEPKELGSGLSKALVHSVRKHR